MFAQLAPIAPAFVPRTAQNFGAASSAIDDAGLLRRSFDVNQSEGERP